MTVDLRCPNCQGTNLLLSGTAEMWVRVQKNGKLLVQATGCDSDSFLDLVCEDCKIAIVNPPGEHRLRHAGFYMNVTDAFEGGDESPDGPLADQLMEIADKLTDGAWNISQTVKPEWI